MRSNFQIKLAPSILSADFTRLGEQVEEATQAGADYIHIDVMDGHFVPALTFGPLIVSAVRRMTSLPLDVHLMVERPEHHIGQFAQAIVAREIEGNQFIIQTDKPNVTVSWQVTGIRHDPYANMYRIPIEEEKPDAERGLYLHPEAYGLPVESGISAQNVNQPMIKNEEGLPTVPSQ